jgi:site-specific recombinase
MSLFPKIDLSGIQSGLKSGLQPLADKLIESDKLISLRDSIALHLFYQVIEKRPFDQRSYELLIDNCFELADYFIKKSKEK